MKHENGFYGQMNYRFIMFHVWRSALTLSGLMFCITVHFIGKQKNLINQTCKFENMYVWLYDLSICIHRISFNSIHSFYSLNFIYMLILLLI